MAGGGTVNGHAADGVRRRQVVLRSIYELVPAAGIAEVEQPAGMRMARLARRRIDRHPADRVPHNAGVSTFRHDCCLSLLCPPQRWGFQWLEGQGTEARAS